MNTDTLNKVYKGILLSRQQYDVNGQCYIELWFKSDVGAIKFTSPQQALFFVKQDNTHDCKILLQQAGIRCEFKELELTTFDHKQVTAVYFNSLRGFRFAKKCIEQNNIETFEGDIRVVDRFLMERHVRSEAMLTGDISTSPWGISISNGRIKHGQVSHPLTKLSLDIECDEKGNLYSIGLYSDDLADGPIRLVLLNGLIDHNTDYIRCCNGEGQLLQALIEQVQLLDPDLIIGWNVVGFDMRLLVAASDRHNIPLLLGRDNQQVEFQDGQRNNEQQYPDKIVVPGRVVLDGIEVMKNATYQFASFSLDFVAKALLQQQKLIQPQQNIDKLQQIKDLYKNDKVALAEYNLQDCKLVTDIFNKENLVEFLLTRGRLTGLALDRFGGSVEAFTNLYLPQIHRQNWVAPNLTPIELYQHSPGGFVMDSKPGFHQDVLVFDFKSLYPSIIRSFNVDPIALVKGLTQNDDDTIEGFRGGRFARDTSILSTMIDELWQARDKAKQQKNSVWSNAIKIIMNSFYGVLGSSGCRFYDTRLASSITMRGHWVLEQTRIWFEQQGVEVIYGDTDSIFICLDNSDVTLEQAKLFEPQLNTWWQQKLTNEFQLTSRLELEFETHFSPFFMPTIRGSSSGSKKRYAGMKVLNEQDKKLVIKGLETVRSDWTELAKQFQQQLLLNTFDNKPCRQYIVETIAAIKSGSMDDLLLYKKRIRRPLNDYQKTTPPHIKAARKANQQNATLMYKKGSHIEYVITTNGPEVISTNQSPIDYQHYIDKQLYPIAQAILSVNSPELLDEFAAQMSLV